jgi:hypothetical protein
VASPALNHRTVQIGQHRFPARETHELVKVRRVCNSRFVATFVRRKITGKEFRIRLSEIHDRERASSAFEQTPPDFSYASEGHLL